MELGVRRRIVYLDIVKGVTIFLVVFGHCIQFGNGKGFDFFGDILFKTIYSFHMPLFALVSGYLFYWSVSKRSPREVLIKQVNNLILPAISWTILYQAAIAAVHIYRGDFAGIGVTLQRIYSGIFGLWFLWAMFYSSVIVLLVREKFKDSIMVYVLIQFLLILLPGRFAPSMYLVYLFPYFAAGYLWHRESMDEKFSVTNNKLLCAGVVLTWCVMLLFYDRSSYIYTTGIRFIQYKERVFMYHQLWIDIFRWIIGFAGCGAVLILLKLVKPVKFIAAIGVRSLGIYIISGYIFNYLATLPTIATGYTINFIQAVIITAVCYALSEFISRVKLLNKIFFGCR